MRILMALLIAGCIVGRPVLVRGDEGVSEVASVAVEEETNAPPASVATTNTPAPALVGIVLSVGTGAMILSGVDWSSDDAPRAEAAGAPKPVRPADGEVVSGTAVAFSWKPAESAATYLVDIDQCDGAGACSDFRLEQTAGLTLVVEWPAGTLAGRWRVRAVDAERYAGSWSEFRAFTVSVPTE